MQKDTLLETQRAIEAYCKENGIPVFYSDSLDTEAVAVTWQGDAPSSWQDYLLVLQAIGPKILHLEIDRNEVAGEEETADIFAYGKTLKGEAYNRWEESFRVVAETEGFIQRLTLTFFHEGFGYKWETEAEWDEHYWNIRPEGEFFAGENTQAEDEVEGERKTTEQQQEAREELLAREAEKFLSNKKYLAARKPGERHTVVLLALEHSPLVHERHRIASLAEKRYQEEVQPKVDADMTQKVKELLQQNPRPNKEAIQARLGLTRGQIAKYWDEAKRSLE